MTTSYPILILFHNGHETLYFGWQLFKHSGSLYGLPVSVLHRQTQFLLNKTKGFNTSLFASMNAFVHSVQLVLFPKCGRGILKATQTTFSLSWRPIHRELSRQCESIKTLKCGRTSKRRACWKYTSSVISFATQNQFVKANLRSNVFVHQTGQTTHMYFCQPVYVRLLILVCAFIIQPVLRAI